MSSGSNHPVTLGHPITRDAKSTTVCLSAPIEESSGQHSSTPSCLVAEPISMGASEFKAEEMDSERVIGDASELGDSPASKESDSSEMQCRTGGPECGDCGAIDHKYISEGVSETAAATNQESDKCDQGSTPIFTNETVKSNETKPGVELLNSSISGISGETARETRQTEACRNLNTVETGHEVQEGCHDEAAGITSDGLENRLDDPSPSSLASGSPSSKIGQVEETLAQAMIQKYFTKQRSDSDNNPLSAYHVSEDKYGKLLLECPEAPEKDLCEHETSSSRFSQLCISNFIQFGPSLIGYPAMSWLEHGYPERFAHSKESSDCEQDKPGQMRVRLWITEKSHPKPNDLKNDIFLKMCGVEEINRSDLMYPHRAYLNVDGNIEYYLNTGTQKEGIADFIDNILRTQNFELNRKEYSPTSESVIDALSRTPQYINSKQAMSDFKKKIKKKRRGRRSHKKSTNTEGLNVDAVKTGDFSDKSTNQSPINNSSGYVELDAPKGTDLAIDELKHGGSAVEVTGNECVDSEQAFSELSVEDSPSKRHPQENNENEGVGNHKNDVSGNVPCLVSNLSGMSETSEKPLGSSKFIDKPDNSIEGKFVNNHEEACQDSSGQVINESSMESMLRDSLILQSLIDDVVKTAETKVHNGIHCSSDIASSTGTTNQTSVVFMESSLQQRGDGTVEDVCSIPSAPETVVDREPKCDAHDAVLIQRLENICVSDSVNETDDSQVSASDEKLTVNGGVSRDDSRMDDEPISEEVCTIPSATETVVDCEPVCDALDAVLIQGIENICVPDLVKETDDSLVGSSDEKLTVNDVVSRGDSKMDEESISEEVDEEESSGQDPDESSEETNSVSESSSETALKDDATDSESDSAETETDSPFQQSSEKLSKSAGTDTDLIADHINIESDQHTQDQIRRTEKVGLSPLPDSLRDIGLQVVHPRGCDVVSRLSKLPDTYWLPESKHDEPKPTINVLKSSDQVGSSLMNALEKTSSKPNGPTKGAESEQGTSSKPKGLTKDDGSAQGTSSKPKSVLKSSDQVGSCLMKALEKTSSKHNGPTKDDVSAQGTSSKPKSVIKSFDQVGSCLMKALEKTSSKPNEPTKGAESGQGTSSKPKSVLKSSDQVGSSLMKALEKTSSKHSGSTKDPESAQDISPKPKSLTNDSGSAQGTSSKLEGAIQDPGSAQGTFSYYVPPWKRIKSPQKERGSTNEKSAESPSLAKLENIAKKLFPTETDKDPSNSAARKGGDNTFGKVMDEGGTAVQKSIPAFLGKLPSMSQGFASHSLADPTTSQLDLGAFKFKFQRAMGAALQTPPSVHTVPGADGVIAPAGSNVSISAGPSTPFAPAPPMGAIPIRPPLAKNSRPPGAKMVQVNYYSNRPDEFGLFVMQSMASMSLEQRVHAINVIWDVLNEGYNNGLCQYTRLSGVMNGQESGKEVFRMGPSHALETQASPGVLSGQPLIYYGFPSNPSPTGLFPRNLDPPNCPIQDRHDFKSADQTQASRNPVPAFQKTTASDQKLHPAGQNVAPKQDPVPPSRNKPVANQKAQKWQKSSTKKKKTKTVQKPQAPSTSQYTFKGKPSKKPSSANQGSGTTPKTVVLSQYSQKKVQNRNSAPKTQNAPPTDTNQAPAQNQPGARNPPSQTQNPATKCQNPASAAQKSAPKPQNSSATGNPSPAGEESNRQKRQRLRKAKYCPNKHNP